MNQRALDEQLPAFEEVGDDELLVCCDKMVADVYYGYMCILALYGGGRSR